MSASSSVVTLLFTDIVGSTRLWEDQHDLMEVALPRHDAVVGQAIEAAGGLVFKTVGDSLCAVFDRPAEAIEAAVKVQQALSAEPWPQGIDIRVRIALHSGACVEREGDYFGPVVNRVARLVAVGHGGQILLSAATRDLVAGGLADGVSLRDLGEHRLKDLGRPERVFQVCVTGLPVEFDRLTSLDNPALQHNLPLQPTSFVGRTTELDELSELLRNGTARLVTLTGVGGAGKTRLGLQVAAQLVDGTGEGVWLTELAPLADSGHVARAVASVLGVRDQPGQSTLDAVVNALSDRYLLIVLDNCEHVIDGAAELAEAVLRSCPRAHLLATSRQPLRVSGEHVYAVAPLQVPTGDDLRPDDVAACEAVQLFVERACAQRRKFTLDETNVREVAQLCARLDGIPLAIELAAARVRTMSVAEINRRLNQRFDLLTGGSRTAVARQRTLRALLDWSYDLLNTHEQLLLDRLSAFAGGCTLEAAEAITAGGDLDDREVLDLLTALVDKSVVHTAERNGESRYVLLDTVRHYAADHLASRGDPELRAVRTAHRDHYLALAETAAARLHGPEQIEWLDRLESEHANLATALAFCVADEAGRAPGLRLAIALQGFWEAHGHYAEGADSFLRLLDDPVGVTSLLRARALHAAAVLLRSQDLLTSSTRASEALALARDHGDPALEAAVLANLAWLSNRQNGPRDALRVADEALRFARNVGDGLLVAETLITRANIRGDLADTAGATEDATEALALSRAVGDLRRVAIALNSLGVTALDAGTASAARAYLEEALSVFEPRDPATPVAVDSLGWLEILDGDHRRARQLFVDSTTSFVRAGFKGHVACSMHGLAVAASASGREQLACTLHGAADQITEAAGWTLESFVTQQRGDSLAHLRESMGDAVFVAAYEHGRGLPYADAITLATGTLEKTRSNTAQSPR